LTEKGDFPGNAKFGFLDFVFEDYWSIARSYTLIPAPAGLGNKFVLFFVRWKHSQRGFAANFKANFLLWRKV